jgi:hypothetical protein
MDDDCRWTEDADAVWATGCGEMHRFSEDHPQQNAYQFCPYCGRALVAVGYVPDEEF